MDLIKIAEQAFAQENAIEIPSSTRVIPLAYTTKLKKETKNVFRFSKVLLSKLREQELPRLLRLEKCLVTWV